MKPMPYVVLVEIHARPERAEDFAAYVDRHAAWSRQEPGCRAFDVCQDAENPAVFHFYEVYDDEAAYLAHRAMPYHPRFFEVVRDMLVMQGESIFVRRHVLRQRWAQAAQPFEGGTRP